MEFAVKTKRWGKEIAIILPRSVTQRELIKAEDEVIIEVKRRDGHHRLFGILKGRALADTQSVKDELREGWQ